LIFAELEGARFVGLVDKTKQAGEKLLALDEDAGEIPPGLKPYFIFLIFMARLKSCPFTPLRPA
jgi:hypothetical protein